LPHPVSPTSRTGSLNWKALPETKGWRNNFNYFNPLLYGVNYKDGKLHCLSTYAIHIYICMNGVIIHQTFRILWQNPLDNVVILSYQSNVRSFLPPNTNLPPC
jgi:hypothetical protein